MIRRITLKGEPTRGKVLLAEDTTLHPNAITKTRCRRLTRLQLRMAECSNPNGRVCPLSKRGLCEGDTMSRARPTLDFS
ncbi:hypothetical protein JTB14_025547 [Gonioctena quinquepunctata]|nr:hypothetical protein JTB14_025547 [Gonioctena quinquepunctata]